MKKFCGSSFSAFSLSSVAKTWKTVTVKIPMALLIQDQDLLLPDQILWSFDRVVYTKEYNKEWVSFFDNTPNPTVQGIEALGRELAGKYDYKIYY